MRINYRHYSRFTRHRSTFFGLWPARVRAPAECPRLHDTIILYMNKSDGSKRQRVFTSLPQHV